MEKENGSWKEYRSRKKLLSLVYIKATATRMHTHKRARAHTHTHPHTHTPLRFTCRYRIFPKHTITQLCTTTTTTLCYATQLQLLQLLLLLILLQISHYCVRIPTTVFQLRFFFLLSFFFPFVYFIIFGGGGGERMKTNGMRSVLRIRQKPNITRLRLV